MHMHGVWFRIYKDRRDDDMPELTSTDRSASWAGPVEASAPSALNVNNMDHECTHVSKLVSGDEKDTPANNAWSCGSA
jgi:hypothetical protein